MNTEKKKTLSTLSAISLLLLTMMGTGINFMPMAFNHMGWGGSWICLITVFIFTFFSLLAIASVTKHYNRKDLNFLIIAKDVSRFEYVMMNLGIFCNGFFATVTFYRFLSDILVSGFPFLKNLHSDYETCRKCVVFLMLPFIVLLSLKERLINLKMVGWIGTLSIFYEMGLVIFYAFYVGNKAYNSPMAVFNDNYKLGLPFFVSCMVCQPNMIGVYHDLMDKSVTNIVKISFLSSLCGLLSYGLIGFCGYFIFGTQIDGDIMKELANMDSKLNVYIRTNTFDKFNILSRLSFYGMISLLVCGFPLQMLPVAEMTTNFVFNSRKTNFKQKLVTLVLLTFTVSLTLIKELNIKQIKRFSGAIFSSAVGLVHPFVFYLHVNRKINVFSICCATMMVIALLSIIYTIKKIVDDLVKW